MSDEERNKATEDQTSDEELTDSELEDVAGGARSAGDMGSSSKINPPGDARNPAGSPKRRQGGHQDD